jgi:hypothetical protein
VISVKMALVISLGLTIGLALIDTAVIAWGPGYLRGFGKGAGSGCPESNLLNLPPKQSVQVQGLRNAFLKEIEPLRRNLLIKRLELQYFRSLLIPDPAAVAAKEKEIRDLQLKLHEKAANHMLESLKILLPEKPIQELPACDPGGEMEPGMGAGPRKGTRGFMGR